MTFQEAMDEVAREDAMGSCLCDLCECSVCIPTAVTIVMTQEEFEQLFPPLTPSTFLGQKFLNPRDWTADEQR